MADDEQRAEALRRATEYRAGTERPDATSRDADEAESRPARARRPEDQVMWVDQQVRAAIERGEFDDLPLQGKPLPHRSTTHDPDWWVKQLIEREQITGVLPPALGLRREDAELDDLLDTTGSEERVRELLDDFNRRVVEARRQLQGGPPVITPLRDVETEVAAWHERRRARAATRRPAPEPPPRRWWRRARRPRT